MDRMEVEGRLHLASESQCHVRMDVVRDGVMYFCRLLVSIVSQESRIYSSPSPRKGQLAYDGVGQWFPKEPG
jgi:hypothetical protein